MLILWIPGLVRGNIIAIVSSRRVEKSYVVKDFIQWHTDANIKLCHNN